MFILDGDTVAMIDVFVRPPKDSCKILVNFDSLQKQTKSNFKLKKTFLSHFLFLPTHKRITPKMYFYILFFQLKLKIFFNCKYFTCMECGELAQQEQWWLSQESTGIGWYFPLLLPCDPQLQNVQHFHFQPNRPGWSFQFSATLHPQPCFPWCGLWLRTLYVIDWNSIRTILIIIFHLNSVSY